MTEVEKLCQRLEKTARPPPDAQDLLDAAHKICELVARLDAARLENARLSKLTKDPIRSCNLDTTISIKTVSQGNTFGVIQNISGFNIRQFVDPEKIMTHNFICMYAQLRKEVDAAMAQEKPA